MRVEFPLYRRKDHAVVVFSDASWSTRSSCMGIVVWCPYRAALYFSSHIVPKHVITLFEWLKLQSTYIYQAESLAYTAAYYTYPDILRHRLVHHFIDNIPARSNVIKGSSSSLISSRIVHAYHSKVLELACSPWAGFVYSEDNIADLPSRFEFDLVRRLGGTRVDMVIPSLRAWRYME